MKRRQRRPTSYQGRAEKIEPKPSSDSPTKASDEWERDRRVRLPHDHLVKSYAITRAEFEVLA